MVKRSRSHNGAKSLDCHMEQFEVESLNFIGTLKGL